MLAMCDRNGVVEGTIPGLARIANVTVEECEAALARFKAPDRYSRSKEHEGRRIDEIDGGWLLLNHAKYRSMRQAEDRREYQRDLMRGRRAAAKAGEATGKQAPAARAAPAGFDGFWAEYPKKVARLDAIKAFEKLKLANGDLERLMAGLRAQKETLDWQREEGRYVPHAATWLGGKRWLDEPGQAAAQPRNVDGSLKVAI